MLNRENMVAALRRDVTFVWHAVIAVVFIGFASLAVVKIIPCTRTFADAILMIQPYIEPDRRIERAVLVQAQPGQFVIKSFRSFRIGEVTIRDSTVGDGARDAMN